MSQMFPRFGRGRHEKNTPGDILFDQYHIDQYPGEISFIWSKLADHVGHHLVLSPYKIVLVTSPRTKSSNPPPIGRTTLSRRANPDSCIRFPFTRALQCVSFEILMHSTNPWCLSLVAP